MNLDDLELLAREGKAGALEMAEADPANADQLRSVAHRFEVAEERCRSARAFLADRSKKKAGRAGLSPASAVQSAEPGRAQHGPTTSP